MQFALVTWAENHSKSLQLCIERGIAISIHLLSQDSIARRVLCY